MQKLVSFWKNTFTSLKIIYFDCLEGLAHLINRVQSRMIEYDRERYYANMKFARPKSLGRLAALFR